MAAQEANMPNVHVVPSGDQWNIELKGGAESTSTTESQEEAICSRTLAKRQQAELIVHGRDEATRMQNSYDNDPRNVKG